MMSDRAQVYWEPQYVDGKPSSHLACVVKAAKADMAMLEAPRYFNRTDHGRGGGPLGGHVLTGS